MAERRLTLLQSQMQIESVQETNNIGQANSTKPHAASKFPPLPKDPSLDEYRKRGGSIDVDAMKQAYFGFHLGEVCRYRETFLAHPKASHALEVTADKLTQRRNNIERLAATYPHEELTYEIDLHSPARKLNYIYALQEFDQAQSVVLSVHSLLYTDSLQTIGTEKHLPLVRAAYSLENYGSLAMTEIGHGSNVSGLETQAVYDSQTKEFVLHSPTATSAKWWIGALANNATHAAVFAQLLVNKVDRGIHVFVVRVRDETHQPMPGVTIGDCGEKIGLNGIDNGFLMFDHYRVPYDALLDRHCKIGPDGKYRSSIKNNEKRFGIQITGLIRGRIAVMMASETTMRSALTVGVRFSAVRKQFGNPEQPILDYELQRWRLMPYIAKLFAFRVFFMDMCLAYKDIRPKIQETPEAVEISEFHAILSAGKALASWQAAACLQSVREALGGHGYSAYAGIGRLRRNHDVQITWEGDNQVLLQQTSKFLLKQVQAMFKGTRVPLKYTSFLNGDEEAVKAQRFSFSSIEELCQPDLLVALLEVRSNLHLHVGLTRLQTNAMKSSGLVEAWNNSQVGGMTDAALAFGEMVLARHLFEFSQHAQANQELLSDIAALYAIRSLHERPELLFIHILTAEQAQVLNEAVLHLVNKIAPASVRLFDSIGMDSRAHGSTLGMEDGQVYKHVIRTIESEKTCYERAPWADQIKKMHRKLN